MCMTMSQKILANHCNLDRVHVGELINVSYDLILGNDLTTPVAINEFYKVRNHKIFDKNKTVLVMDHFTPNKDIAAAQQCLACRKFAEKHSIKHFFDVGQAGIEHVLLPERGFVKAGDLIIGADSHTCTYGALGAFSTGIGSTDMAAAMITGNLWLRVPPAIKIEFIGKPGKWIGGKDVILTILQRIGVDGGLYSSLEFFGDGVKYLSIDDRLTICNMAVESGAKNGIFLVDELTLKYLKKHSRAEGQAYEPDKNAQYDEEILIDLSKIKSVVAFPHSPGNVKVIDDIHEIKIDQVVIGSCTNGRLSDIQIAAEIMKGKKVAKGVKVIIIPATQNIYLRAIEEGYIKDLVEAGCVVSAPTCGPCIGGSMGVLGENEKAIATTNRNFKGRMGHQDSEVYLAGPAVAASSAVIGKISSPEEVMN